jgi:LmbE family N-acetylglucosaminyl deacetylase
VTRPADALSRGPVLALSPHVDDAVFSVGAALAQAARAGARVTVLTVLAGDPAATGPSGPWDARAGFADAGAASRGRREEDRAACALIGATPVWLPFWDAQYGRAADDEIWAALAGPTGEADVVLVPGFPLINEDHAWLTELVLARAAPDTPVLAYVEQPYATWYRHDRARVERLREAVLPGGATVDWEPVRSAPRAWLAKQRAALSYRSQLGAMARPLARVPLRVGLYELARGGERLGRVKAR